MDFIKKDIILNNKEFYTLSVSLPKSTLLIVGNNRGFIMCGALNVDIYNIERMKSRKVICANVVGVKTIEELLNDKINKVSDEAKNIGITEGMMVLDALNLLS